MKAATSRLLLTSLYDFLKETVKGYPFPDPSGKWQDCRVFLHGLPEEQDTETYPFVILRWTDGEISSREDGATIVQDTVALILGVNAPRAQAEAGLLCAELLDVLRYAFWNKRIIASRFELVEPLRAAMPGPEREIHNFHMATIDTVWNYVWPAKAQAELTKFLARNL